MDTLDLRENERRILTLLSEKGPLTRKELADLGDMGWATVVKMTNRLLERGFLCSPGTAPNKESLGKNAYIYDLVADFPLFIGIDIEYSTTTFIVSNLKNEILTQEQHPTASRLSPEEFIIYLGDRLASFIEGMPFEFRAVKGIGVGVPAWLFENPGYWERFAVALEGRFRVPVLADNCIRAYTLFKEKQVYRSENFILITIRRGVGMGIIYQGTVFTGENGLAGEIGHIPVRSHGRSCRCGGAGCLETEVNEMVLYQRVLEELLGESAEVPLGVEESPVSQAHITEVLENWLLRAKAGDGRSLELMEEVAGYLARALTSIVLVFNIHNIMIVAPFGDQGSVIVERIDALMAGQVFGPRRWDLRYRELSMDAFSKGAALMAMREFFDYSILG